MFLGWNRRSLHRRFVVSERIKATDTARDVFLKLSEETPNGGAFNPGGLNVCMQIMEKGAKIDPDCPFPLLALLSFDTLGIYGSRIWMLYKDVCKQDQNETQRIKHDFF